MFVLEPVMRVFCFKKHRNMAKQERKGTATQSEIKHAEFLYTERGFTPPEIAEEIGRNLKTIYGWRDKYGWNDTKDLLNTTPSELKKILLQEATRLVKGEVRKDAEGKEIPPIDADSLSKVMKAYDYMSKKASPEVCFDIITELDSFISRLNPKLAEENLKYHRMYLTQKIEEQDGK